MKIMTSFAPAPREQNSADIQLKRHVFSRGFTLIELIVVIVILGILAATAIHKLINTQREARIAALQGLQAAVHSTVEMGRGVYNMSTIDKTPTLVVIPVPLPGGSTVDYGFYANGVGSSGLASFPNISYLADMLEGMDRGNMIVPNILRQNADPVALYETPSGFVRHNSILTDRNSASSGMFFYTAGKLPVSGQFLQDVKCYYRYNNFYLNSTNFKLEEELQTADC